jgi:short-subunit dehydrogenase
MTAKNTAMITGATSGIGAAFARELAKQNYNLIITGRREDKIRNFAQELRNKYNIIVEVIIAELANDKDLVGLTNKIEELENLTMLINNAGFTKRDYFIDGDQQVYADMLKVHALATMKLTRAALPNMIAVNKGTIINVSSIGAFMPVPRNSIYVASKAFVNSFTETISKELKDTNVLIQLLCPGMTRTDIFERMGEDIDEVASNRSWLWKPMSAEAVVKASFNCLQRNKVICIPGMLNKINVIMKTLQKLF